MFESKEQLLDDLVGARASVNEMLDCEMFLNLTDQSIGVEIEEYYSWAERWPKDGDKVMRIESFSSREAYALME